MMSMPTPADTSLTVQQISITSPTGGTICNTVCVCGRITNYKKKRGDSSSSQLLTQTVEIVGGDKSCTATVKDDGSFCCELKCMDEGSTTITVTYIDGDDTMTDSVEVCVDKDACKMAFTTPSCGCDDQGSADAAPVASPTIKFQTVPENAQCRLSIKEVPDGNFQELQTMPAKSNESVTFDQAKLDPAKSYLLKAELLDADKKVILTTTAMQMAEGGS